MGSHPINLVVRFFLEIVGLVSLGMWGWQYGDRFYRFLLAPGIPIMAAALWGTFAVRDDPSRSGRTVIAVPGAIRLVIELAFFIAATWSLFDINATVHGWIYGMIVFVHYVFSYDRVVWLLRQ